MTAAKATRMRPTSKAFTEGGAWLFDMSSHIAANTGGPSAKTIISVRRRDHMATIHKAKQ